MSCYLGFMTHSDVLLLKEGEVSSLVQFTRSRCCRKGKVSNNIFLITSLT